MASRGGRLHFQLQLFLLEEESGHLAVIQGRDKWRLHEKGVIHRVCERTGGGDRPHGAGLMSVVCESQSHLRVNPSTLPRVIKPFQLVHPMSWLPYGQIPNLNKV